MLKGVHFLLTYRCDAECDHCFVWGSPKAKGVFTLERVRNILIEARKLGSVYNISLEGGEPFLYYPIMVKAIEEAVKMGFGVEVLSNCYWASCPEDAVEWLLPLTGFENVKLSVSSDFYHGERWTTDQVRNAVKAANTLKMKTGIIAIKYPKTDIPCPNEIEGAKVGLSELMYRGRAALELTGEAEKKPWYEFTRCPYEDLSNPGRVHIDPFGYVHVCQGISIGNASQKPFSKIIEEYNSSENPIFKPLIDGGPAALVEKFDLSHEEYYADACHLCYNSRCILRNKYPRILVPDQMYGIFE